LHYGTIAAAQGALTETGILYVLVVFTKYRSKRCAALIDDFQLITPLRSNT
jgi:hypothetical protein